MCGIVGVYSTNRAAELATLALFAEQHRGQESCGMAVSDGNKIKLRKKLGLVKNVFREKKLKKLTGRMAIGHVRYPTRGVTTENNSQPHVVETLFGPSYALVSNGDIVNYDEMRKKLEHEGVFFSSNNDGELILRYLVYLIEIKKLNVIDAIKKIFHNIKGAYSTIFITKDNMYIFRDPHGFRPLCYGQNKKNITFIASESCALDILKSETIKEVKPAQIIEIKSSQTQIYAPDAQEFKKSSNYQHCIFEHIYFSRPDSKIFQEKVFEKREKLGYLLAENDDIDADAVIPVPDSANFIALGYAKAKNIPFEMGLIRNHYVGRTFIKPEQTIRDESVSQKFNVLPEFFINKKIILIDDSIVRGTTVRKIVKLIKNAGAKEVHLRIGSPKVKFSCYYGIDTPTRNELIANRKSVAEINQYVNADSLKFLTVNETKKIVDNPDDYCFACFNGKYPLKKENHDN